MTPQGQKLLDAYEQRKKDLEKMPEHLNMFIRNNLLSLLHHSLVDDWNSIDVLYHKPRVERLWRAIEIEGCKYRLGLHPIHPVDHPAECLDHYHPWGSTVKILSVGYNMGFSFGDPWEPAPPKAITSFYGPGSTYSMLHPFGRHYVQPTGIMSTSIILMAEPWEKGLFPPEDETHDMSVNQPIDRDRKKLILTRFREDILHLIAHDLL